MSRGWMKKTFYLVTLGSVISITPLCSIICGGLDADFATPPSNDFNRLEGKLANRRWSVVGTGNPASIEGIRLYLDFFSQTSVAKRGYVQREMKLALDIWEEIPEGQIHTIPVRLDACEIPERFKPFQWVDIFDKRAFEKTIQAIQLGLSQRDRFKTGPSDTSNKSARDDTKERPGGFLLALENLFSNKRPATQARYAGADLRYDLLLPLEEAVFGTEKILEFEKEDTCPSCLGNEPALSSCIGCHGKGLQSREVKLSIIIPAGIDDGGRLRLVGEGEPGVPPGFAPGDLY